MNSSEQDFQELLERCRADPECQTPDGYQKNREQMLSELRAVRVRGPNQEHTDYEPITYVSTLREKRDATATRLDFNWAKTGGGWLKV